MVQNINHQFVLDYGKEDLEIKLSEFEQSASDKFNEVNLSFKNNLFSMLSTVTMPDTMATGKANLDVYNSIRTQESILSLKINEENDGINEETRNARVLKKTSERFFAERKTEEGKNQFTYIRSTFLKDLSDSNEFRIASQNLLNQSTLSIWTSFEVFCRDCFVILLNHQNELVGQLSSNADLKQKFNLKNIPVQKLIEFDYNLSNSMGSILIDNFEFSNLTTIKTVYKSIFRNSSLTKNLEDDKLWLLFKRRNLIVHKSGIVDNQYLTSTSDNLPLNSKLNVTPSEVIEYLELVIKVAKEIKGEIENYCA